MEKYKGNTGYCASCGHYFTEKDQTECSRCGRIRPNSSPISPPTKTQQETTSNSIRDNEKASLPSLAFIVFVCTLIIPAYQCYCWLDTGTWKPMPLSLIVSEEYKTELLKSVENERMLGLQKIKSWLFKNILETPLLFVAWVAAFLLHCIVCVPVAIAETIEQRVKKKQAVTTNRAGK